MTSEGRRFVKHTGVRSALHQWLVKPGRLGKEWGEFYDDLFQIRAKADYVALTSLKVEEVADSIEGARAFVAELERLTRGPSEKA